MSRRHWFPYGARGQWIRPEPGSLIATRRAVYRVVEYRPYYEDQWTDEERERVRQHGEDHAPYHIILRSPNITSDDPRARDHDKSYSIRDPRMTWWVYPDEHYPLCGTCGEPSPCREREAAREADRVISYVARYEDPTKCPGCLKTVTKRGRHITLPNIYVPLGQPVTFHLRSNCARHARDYEKQVAKQDPTHRPILFCEGHFTEHSASSFSCTQGTDCPGPMAAHRSYGRHHSSACKVCYDFTNDA